jgi:acyl-coenzyme A synthetase/AMP-(fatty) acid ligase
VLNEGPDSPSADRRTMPVGDMRTSASAVELPVVTLHAGDLAPLIYTSGSTGNPKGVRLDHANLLAMATMLPTISGSPPMIIVMTGGSRGDPGRVAMHSGDLLGEFASGGFIEELFALMH